MEVTAKKIRLKLDVTNIGSLRSAIEQVQLVATTFKDDAGIFIDVGEPNQRSCYERDETPQSHAAVTQLFQSMGLLRLCKLHIQGFKYKVPASLLAATIRQSKNTLLTLGLSKVHVTGDANELFGSLDRHPCMEKFTLYNARFDKPESFNASTLVRLLKSCHNLKTIQLGVGMTGPVSELSSFPKLENLWLSFGFVELSSFQQFCWNMRSNKSLRRLSLGGGSFPQEKLFAVMQSCGTMLEANTSLTQLKIRISDMVGCPLLPIAHALCSNRVLECLDLHFYQKTPITMPDEITQAFLCMLKENDVLKKLKLTSEYSWSDPVIPFYLKLNGAGRRDLVRNENSTREAWVDMIIAQRDDPSVVFYFLSKNPSLCLDISGTRDVEPRPAKRQKLGVKIIKLS